jgi:hypothetical protein
MKSFPDISRINWLNLVARPMVREEFNFNRRESFEIYSFSQIIT